jgi:S1-C subfamily serine protease
MAVSLLVLFAASRHFGAGGGSAGNGNNPGTRLQLPGGGTGDPGTGTGDLNGIPGQQGADGYYQGERDENTPENGYVAENATIDTASVPVTQKVAKMATAGVVGITVERAVKENLFSRNRETEVGFGSGVIVSSDGYILTNNHVAGGRSNRIIVSLADGRNVEGEVVWSDPVLDLAAVKINLTGLMPLALGDATKLQVGEHAIAIGNPLGLDFQRSVTSGIISALNRTIRIETEEGVNYMEDLIQTDASINPGNSGGPLLNAKGEVVGINTVKVTSAEGMGFAIPINIMKPVVARLVESGKFEEPYMGIFAYDGQTIPYIDGQSRMQNGIYVAHVDSNGPAYRAGIREGCIIARVDDNEINTMMQLRTYIYTKQPGDTVRIYHKKRGIGEWITTRLVLAHKERDGLITR